MSTPLNNPITEDDIAHYLSITPDFFARHAQLLAAVQLSSPHSHRAVSLQERQAEMLREKIKLLEQRLMEMLRHGNDNVLLSDRVLRWACALLQGCAPAALPARIVQDIQNQFTVPQVALRLWGLDSAYAELPCAQAVSDDLKVFADSLAEPFCGLNTGFEAALWLSEPESASSLALLPLRNGPAESPAFGLMVLASSDPQRFGSGMCTDFLSRISELASAALSPLRSGN